MLWEDADTNLSGQRAAREGEDDRSVIRERRYHPTVSEDSLTVRWGLDVYNSRRQACPPASSLWLAHFLGRRSGHPGIPAAFFIALTAIAPTFLRFSSRLFKVITQSSVSFTRALVS